MNKQEFEKQIKSCKSIAKDQDEYTKLATRVILNYASKNKLNYGESLDVYSEIVKSINIKNKQK